MPETNPKQTLELQNKSPDCSGIITRLLRQVDKNGIEIHTKEDSVKYLLGILDAENNFSKPKIDAHWLQEHESLPYFDPKPNVISFTEATFSGIKIHRDIFKCNYGISFKREFILEKDGSPCIIIPEGRYYSGTKNEDGKLHWLFHSIPDQIKPFLSLIRKPNAFHDGYDISHEREWRIAGDLHFKIEDVFIIFCPQEDFPIFMKAQDNGIPILFDLKWLDLIC